MSIDSCRLVHLLPLLLPIVGCSAKGADGGDSADSGRGLESDGGGDTAAGDGADGDGDTSIEAPEPAAWWRIEARFTIDEGQADAETGHLLYTSLDAELNERCTAEADMEGLTAQSPPSELILAWWRVLPGTWSGDCITRLGEGIPLDDGFNLGIGQMHAEILAVLDTVEDASGDSAHTLNAAYARLGTGSEVYVFGIAGQPGAFSGETGPAESVPLADGEWTIKPVYAFPAESSDEQEEPAMPQRLLTAAQRLIPPAWISSRSAQ